MNEGSGKFAKSVIYGNMMNCFMIVVASFLFEI